MAVRKSAVKQAGCPSVVQVRLSPTPGDAVRLAAAVAVCTRYKAERAGIAFIQVDAASTSQTCPACGHVARRNRPARGTFRCSACGLAGHADHIAAINIAHRGVDGRGAVNRPHATGLPSARRAPESKPRASTRGR